MDLLDNLAAPLPRHKSGIRQPGVHVKSVDVERSTHLDTGEMQQVYDVGAQELANDSVEELVIRNRELALVLNMRMSNLDQRQRTLLDALLTVSRILYYRLIS